MHYDENPLELYKMLIALDADKTFKKMLLFFALLDDMFRYTKAILDEFQLKNNL